MALPPPPTLAYGAAAPRPWMMRVGIILGAVAVAPPVLLVLARVAEPWAPRFVWSTLAYGGLFGTVVGPFAAIVTLVLGGIGFRRHRQARFVWLQALGVVGLIASCGGFRWIGRVASGYR